MDYATKILTIALSNKIEHKDKYETIKDMLNTVYKNGRFHRNINSGL